MLKWTVVSLLACLLVVCACGKKNEGEITYYQSQGLNVRFDSSVSAEHQEIIKGDFDALKNTNLTGGTAEYAKLLGVRDFSGASLSYWLGERLKVVVGENYDEDSLIHRVGNQTYSPSLMVNSNTLSADRDALSQIQTVMFNIGSYYYLKGKGNGDLYSMSAGGIENPVYSPRVGIVQIGEGLFDAIRIKSIDEEDDANRDTRGTVYIHESTHTDGNGDDAAMPHEKCVSGTYAGRNSCDKYYNGPYGNEAVVMYLQIQNCSLCTNATRSAMQAYMIDSQSRVLDNAVYQDRKPEGIRF